MEESENYYIAAQIPYTSLNPEHLELMPKSLYERIPTDRWQDIPHSVWFQFNYGFDEQGNQIEGPFRARLDIVKKKDAS